MRVAKMLCVSVCLLALGIWGTGTAVAQDQEQADQEQPAQTAEAQAEEGGSTTDIADQRRFKGEITVTSTRREVNVREVPASVVVTEGADLESIGVTSMDDFVAQVPGVNYIDAAPQRDSVTMRGITTGVYSNLNQPPVGTYINEIPITDYFFYLSNFDVMGFDLERVEFLKGPQGTMYGAASLGGTMRYILNRPNLNRNQGAIHLTTQAVTDGGINWLAQGMFNVVLAPDKFALRGVAAYQDDAGWIDNAYLQEEDWNAFDQTNLRLMASWTPTDKVRLDATFLSMDSNINYGSGYVDGPDLDNPATATDDGGIIRFDYDYKQRIANLTLYWDLGFGDLVSSSSYLRKEPPFYTATGGKGLADGLITQAFILGLVGLPVDPNYLIANISEGTNDAPLVLQSWFQEVRIVSKDTGRFDWLAGVYYADTRQDGRQFLTYPGMEDLINGIAPGVGTILYPEDTWVDFNWWDAANELSFYADFGIDLTDKLKLNLGGRYTDWERDSFMTLQQWGGALVSQQSFPPTFDEQIFSPKASISYRASNDALWYALVSKGYRTGGANNSYLAGGGDLEQFFYFKTDDLINYETGIKKSWSGGKYITDFTVYYLDWTDIQLEGQFPDPRQAGFINAIFNTAAAHTFGAEASINLQLTPGLSLSTAITYMEAELDEATPQLLDVLSGEIVVLPKGTPLPATPEWSTSTTLQYFWDNPKLGFPFIAIDHFYKDSIVVWLTNQNTVPAYDTWGLRVGATFSSGINLTLHVRNLTDTRAWNAMVPSIPYSNLPGGGPEYGWMTQPRAVSLSIQKNF